MNIKKTACLVLLTLVSGCVGTGHLLPPVDHANLVDSTNTIKNAPIPTKIYISDGDAAMKVYEIFDRIRPSAAEICRFVDEGACSWQVHYSPDSELNAYAYGENKVVIQKGILEYAQNDDEIAMVVAHEVSHHVANHIQETKNNRLVGAILAGIAAAYLVKDGYQYDPDSANNVVQSSMELGAMAGHLAFSRKQETEADYLSAYIVKKSGYNLDNAGKMLVKMARLNGQEKSSFFHTHPAGPERVASWELTKQEITSSTDLMPSRKPKSKRPETGQVGD